MKIALIGYGKMGKAIENWSAKTGDVITAKITSKDVLTLEALNEADVCIDFSHPHAILETIKILAPLGKNMVIGTTGWDHQLEEVQNLVKKHSIGLIYAPNFSLGVNLFLDIVEEAAKMLAPFEEFDVAGIESHHNQKIDSPSGTAKAITQRLVKQMVSKAVSFTSVRCGSIPGTHTILFDSPFETITLTHQARSQDGFAKGALLAAKWIENKKGFYQIQDMLFDKTFRIS